MTANQDQIQRLLTEVQEVLAQSPSRLPWGNSAQIARQRQVLEQIQACLKEILFQLNHQAVSSSETQARDVMKCVIDEMNALRSSLIRPLHSEVATLMQQRNALTREIRQLEAHRQLLEQPTSLESAPQPHLQSAQAAQDLTTLDTALHVIFESLQRDIQAYQHSLSQGIDKLHHLGKRSEAMFTGLVERLATQIEQDAVTRLQPASASPSRSAQTAFIMPYAGSEFVVSGKEAVQAPAMPTITVLTQLIDQLELSEGDEFPNAMPAAPPQSGRSGREVPSELKQLFAMDLPWAEPAINASTYSELIPETPLE